VVSSTRRTGMLSSLSREYCTHDLKHRSFVHHSHRMGQLWERLQAFTCHGIAQHVG
jgi:hypothetical protein